MADDLPEVERVGGGAGGRRATAAVERLEVHVANDHARAALTDDAEIGHVAQHQQLGVGPAPTVMVLGLATVLQPLADTEL